jgi:UDP:flavonoid glycosyltransferase YjiC (YdhE family)
MKMLFSAVPLPGHVLPQLSLADAAADAEHETAFLAAADMAGYLGGRTLLPTGPGAAELLAETDRRTGGDARHPGEAAVEGFAGVRIDLGYRDALDQARRYAPSLMVCDSCDFVGPMVAATLDVPWIEFAITAPIPQEISAALRARADAQHAARSLRPRQRLALIDPLPDVLRLPTDPPLPDDRVAMRPSVHAGGRIPGTVPELPAGRPRVLLTAGTSVQDPELLPSLVSSITAAGFQAVVTVEPGTLPDNPRLREIGFVPLAQLLPEVDGVVGTAGTGTVLATLAAGLPAVLRPVLADQPWNAARVAEAGAGIVIDDPAAAGPALRTVLSQPQYRAAAQVAAEAIRSMPAPDVVLNDLLVRAGLST